MSTTHLIFPEHHMSQTGGRADLCTCNQLNISQKHCLHASRYPRCIPLRPSGRWSCAGNTRANHFPRTLGIHEELPTGTSFVETKPITSFPKDLAAIPLPQKELTPGLLIQERSSLNTDEAEVAQLLPLPPPAG